MSPTTDITVRYASNTYITNKVGKQQASNTAGPEGAAAALARKLYGASVYYVEQIGKEDSTMRSKWRIHAKPIYAYCWQTGLIDFGPVIPEGALGFAKGLEMPLRQVVSTLARHGQGRSDGKLLVPGVPEAPEHSPERVDALIAWQAQCARGDGKEGRYGVVFGGKL
ncbi:MAG: hypothetical protein Q7K57_49260 [Burkholderiaceae bacterium]|nr:hypothetical protein [Burkholderiaceae bacterium]